MDKIKKAVIPAAGWGTRLLPLTKAVPKAMLPIVDVPAIEIIVREIIESGIHEILIIVNDIDTTIKRHFSRLPALEKILEESKRADRAEAIREISLAADISYVVQREQKGLADAICCAKSFTGNEPFAVALGDDIVYSPKNPVTAQLTEIFKKTNKCILGVQRAPQKELHKYGVIKCEQKEKRLYAVHSMTEKPIKEPPSDLAIFGRYIFTAEIYDAVEKTNPPQQAAVEIYLTDAFNRIAAEGNLLGYEFEGSHYDVGDKFGYLKATVEYALRHRGLSGDFHKYLEGILLK